MVRPVLTLAAFGVVGVLAWQLVWGLVLPLVFGLLAVALKIMFWVVVIACGIWLVKRITRTAEERAV
jgi:hypothetical protein